MVRLFVKHRVADYKAWREAYDGFAPVQREMGVVAQAVCQDVADEQMVTITHDFATLDSAKALMADPRLREAMAKAGVAAAPDVWFTTIR